MQIHKHSRLAISAFSTIILRNMSTSDMHKVDILCLNLQEPKEVKMN